MNEQMNEWGHFDLDLSFFGGGGQGCSNLQSKFCNVFLLTELTFLDFNRDIK